MRISDSDIDRVCLAVKRGARLHIGRDHSGRQRVKLVRGPFGLFVKRFECSESDIATIQARLGHFMQSSTPQIKSWV